MINEYTIIDIETTGLKCEEGAEITEIAGINVIDRDIITCYSSLCSINGEINDFIENLTGINNKMVSNAPSFKHVFNDMVNVLNIKENTNIVIHNAQFDYNFIKYWADKEAHTMEAYMWGRIKPICSLELARTLIPGSRKLEDLKKKFGIKSKSHRALNDVFVTKKIYEKLIDMEGSK